LLLFSENATQEIHSNRLKSLLAAGKHQGVALVNLQQGATFHTSLRQRAPALLTGSDLFDIVSGQEVLPVQHWLIQGFPVPGLCSPDLSKRFPFPTLVSAMGTTLTDSSVKTLTGNAMHQAAVGVCLLYALASTEKLHRGKCA